MGSCSGVYYALDVVSGEVVWSHDFREEVGHATFHGDPLLTSSNVITGTESLDPVQARAFDRSTGRVVWRREGEWAFTRSDVVAVGDLAIGRNDRAELVALDAATGEKAWHVPHDGVRYRPDVAESPAVHGTDVFFSAPDGGLYRVDGRSGEVRWRIEVGCDVSTSLLVHRGDVHVGCASGRLHRISAADGANLGSLDLDRAIGGRLLASGEEIVVTGGRRWIGAVDRELAGVRWERTDLGRLSVVQPFRWRGAVLTGATDGTLIALDPADGRVLWTVDLEGRIRGLGAHGDVLLVGTEQGVLHALRAR